MTTARLFEDITTRKQSLSPEKQSHQTAPSISVGNSVKTNANDSSYRDDSSESKSTDSTKDTSTLDQTSFFNNNLLKVSLNTPKSKSKIQIDMTSIKLLGEGGMGKVFVANDKYGHEYILKSGEFTLPEKETLKRLGEYYGEIVIQVDEKLLIAHIIKKKGKKNLKEFMEDKECKTSLNTEATLKKLALDCIAELLKLHAMGFCHNDIQLKNMTIDENGVYLIDFGTVTDFEPINRDLEYLITAMMMLAENTLGQEKAKTFLSNLEQFIIQSYAENTDIARALDACLLNNFKTKVTSELELFCKGKTNPGIISIVNTYMKYLLVINDSNDFKQLNVNFAKIGKNDKEFCDYLNSLMSLFKSFKEKNKQPFLSALYANLNYTPPTRSKQVRYFSF